MNFADLFEKSPKINIKRAVKIKMGKSCIGSKGKENSEIVK